MSKGKIGIVTITEGNNYGNRLQNWALQSVIESYGYTAETLFHYTYNPRWYLAQIKDIIKQLFHFFRREPHNLFYYKRAYKFRLFNKKNIRKSKLKIIDGKIGIGDLGKYNYFITGSDQVWNTELEIIPNNLEVYCLQFINCDKRISYAASFGTAQINHDYEDKFKRYLGSFKALSVRETTGAAIINNLISKNVPVVLDPTLLIKKKEWEIFAKKPKFNLNKEFIVTYFLEKGNNVINLHKKLESKTPQYKIINIQGEFITSKDIKFSNIYCIDPSEFVWLVAHAKYVFTDSFHATVFSIIFNRPFMVYDRLYSGKNNMESRIDTLLNKFSLSNHKAEWKNDIIYPCEFDELNIQRILNHEQKESKRFLEKALL